MKITVRSPCAVFGTVNRIANWFTIGLISRMACGNLILVYGWGWPVERTFFLVKITAARCTSDGTAGLSEHPATSTVLEYQPRRRRKSLPAMNMEAVPMVTSGQYSGRNSLTSSASRKLPRRMCTCGYRHCLIGHIAMQEADCTVMIITLRVKFGRRSCRLNPARSSRPV
jgi:hypothetical protein